MRFLRFTLLQTYFLSIQKNRRKSLVFINIGIFLSIFAFSSSAISFFIEKKISDIQNDLMYDQITVRDENNTISKMENEINSLSKYLNKENSLTSKQRFIDEFKFLNKVISARDYYAPFIYYNLLELEKEIKIGKENMGVDIFDKNDPFYLDYLIPILKKGWDKEKVDEFIKSLEKLDFYTKEILKINIQNYTFQNHLSIDEIISEINNDTLSSLNMNSKILQDYTLVYDSFEAMLDFYEIMNNVFKGFKGQNDENIFNAEKEIIYYSSLERKVILITFIFQFIIFSIIQIFEINSVNFNLRKKIK